jgi:predicted AAA+ superfamily ATPase
LDLKEKIHESLAGRKRIFELGTVSFQEFVDFKTEYRYSQKMAEFFDLEKEKALAFLVGYMVCPKDFFHKNNFAVF